VNSEGLIIVDSGGRVEQLNRSEESARLNIKGLPVVVIATGRIVVILQGNKLSVGSG